MWKVSKRCASLVVNYPEANIIVVHKQLINHQIKSPQVLLIDHENNNRGLIDTKEALSLAESLDLDLVVVSEAKEVPVTKILNYGKFQYQQKKRQNQSSRPVVKEVRFRPNVGTSDYQIRIEQAIQWLSKGDSVKFLIRLRGREHQYRDRAGELLERIAEDLNKVGKIQLLDKRSLIVQIIPG
ncbi:translation initiation factor IF-3 [Aetokthonos hydrillicola]|uniref:translation initiation factor IF-3 n=1 Tax=Aetokthonos hydrillicola TaxID=1550245 RepID=UPI002443DE85|nr:translation initiation factor IF-3 [Aetokthonos hydrillicola]